MTPADPTPADPTHDEVLDLLRGAIATVLELDPMSVTRETRFVQDLAADSLAIVQIVDVLEETAGLSLDDGVLDDLLTVGDAVDHVLARR